MAVSLLPGAEPVCACVCAATITIDSQMGTMDATYAIGGACSFVLESQQPGTYYTSNPEKKRPGEHPRVWPDQTTPDHATPPVARVARWVGYVF